MKIDLCCKKMGIAITEGSITIFANNVFASPVPAWLMEIWIKGQESPVFFCPYCGERVKMTLGQSSLTERNLL